MKRALIGLAAAALALAIGLGWISFERANALERRLVDAKQQS